jgi:hypothetical protein
MCDRQRTEKRFLAQEGSRMSKPGERKMPKFKNDEEFAVWAESKEGRAIAERKSVPYQTWIKMVVHEAVEREIKNTV